MNRATYLGLPTTGQSIHLQLPILEAAMRAELLNGTLPDRATTAITQKGTSSILDLFFILPDTLAFRSARVKGLIAIETPVRAQRRNPIHFAQLEATSPYCYFLSPISAQRCQTTNVRPSLSLKGASA